MKQAINQLEQRPILPGFKVRFLHSDRMTFAFWEIEEGAELPEHQHEHEQVMHVHEGQFSITIDGDTETVVGGEVCVIPSNAVHSGKAMTPCRVMDVFCPVREDYR
ncbi:MAG: cupin domain-containing protein [Verrucomicrobiota bacterium]